MSILKATVIFLILISIACHGKPYTEKEITSRAIVDLEHASDWFIQSGIAEYFTHESSVSHIQKKILQEWAVSTFSGPEIGSDRFNARFIIKASGIYYEILNLYSLEDDFLYEYWIVKMSSEEWVDFNRGCKFLITKAGNFHSERKIIKEENQFFSSWSATNKVHNLPSDNMEMEYHLAAWLFPSCYKNTNLVNYEIQLNTDGSFVRRAVK